MSLFDLDSVLERASLSAGVNKDSELAEVLGVTRQTLSKWRQRDSIPYEKLIEFAKEKGVSLNFLFLGKEAASQPQEINCELMDSIHGRLKDPQEVAGYHFDWDGRACFHASGVYNLLIRTEALESILNLQWPEQRKALEQAVERYNKDYFQQEEERSAIMDELVRKFNAKIADEKVSETKNSSHVQQTFNSTVDQVAGRDIHNKKKK